MTIFMILFVIYLAALLIISWLAGRGETEEGFLIAGRDRTWWQVGISKYAAAVGAGWFLAYSGFAYEYGSPVFLIFAGATVGVLLYAFWAVPRIYAQTSQAYTIGDYVFARTKSEIAKQFVNITAIVMLSLNLLIAVVGGSTLLQTFGLFTYELGVILMVSTVVTYMLLSGFRAVMLTDILQGVLLLLLLLVISVGLLQVQSVPLDMLLVVRDISGLGMAILVVFGVVSVFADPTRFQVTYAGKDTEAVRRGMLFSIVPLLVTGGLIFLFSNAVYLLNPNLEAAAVFPTALLEYVPVALVPFGFLAFFVALMSTSDSNLYALASHSTMLPNIRTTNRKTVRWLLVAYGALLICLGLLLRDLIDVAVLTGALLIIVAIPMIYLIANGTSGLRFVTLLAGGWFGAFLGVIVMGIVPDAGIFVLLGFILVSLIPERHLLRLFG